EFVFREQPENRCVAGGTGSAAVRRWRVDFETESAAREGTEDFGERKHGDTFGAAKAGRALGRFSRTERAAPVVEGELSARIAGSVWADGKGARELPGEVSRVA